MKPNLLIRIAKLVEEVGLVDQYQTVSVYLDAIQMRDYRFLDEFMELAPKFLVQLLLRQKRLKFDRTDRSDSFYPEKWMVVWKDITVYAVHIIETVNIFVDQYEIVLSFDYDRFMEPGDIARSFNLIKYMNDDNNFTNVEDLVIHNIDWEFETTEE